jgi:uncharacterized membrane protein YdfJ with MMPL/SSD domain
MFASLARFTFRRRWLVIGAWLLLLAAGFAFGPRVFGRLGLESGLRPDAESVRTSDRLQRTGRIVTSAALLIVVVFLGFAVSDLLTIKEVGLGMAIAIALDATVVRTLLVPATMKLMGHWNWWAPAGLGTLRRVGLAEQVPVAVQPRPAPAEERAPVS